MSEKKCDIEILELGVKLVRKYMVCKNYNGNSEEWRLFKKLVQYLGQEERSNA